MALGRHIEHVPGWDRPGDRPIGHYLHLHYHPLFTSLRDELAKLEGRVLDVGCGLQPYRELLGPKVTEHVGLDRPGKFTAPDVEGDATNLPFEPATFDAVLSTQVLEHVPDPHAAVAQIARVLKPGGRVVLTAPGCWPHHEQPYDFFRYTRFGLEELFRKDFVDVRITEQGGTFSTIGMMLNLELQQHRGFRSLIPLVNRIAVMLERRGAARHELVLNWLVTARRK